ncbi:glycosyltransferase [Candidatus Woesearchaeota archaeon]|nr:glycosyltransferase [Candidatus Woesearchaeota archaeon]
MATISVCMIVKNEEDCLERCLNSVKNLADEIIIVDTGSTDKTKEIAKRFTEKILDFKWIDDFSAARNFSIKHAKSDWILVLDADEMISDEDIYVIKDLVEKKNAVAYSLNQVDYVKAQGRYGVLGQNKEIQDRMPTFSKPIARLFRNKKGFSYRNKIHEVIEPSIESSGHNIEPSNVQILHIVDENDFSLEKQHNYLKLGLEQIKNDPSNSKQYVDVAKLYLLQGNADDAKQLLAKAIEIDNKDPEAYFVLGQVYEQDNMIDDAIKCYKMSVKFNPYKSEAYVGLGTMYSRKRDLSMAIKVYEKAVENKIWNVFLLNNLAFLYLATNESAKAIRIYQQILDSGLALSEPLKVKIINNLVNAYINMNLFDEAVQLLKKSREEMPAELSFHSNLIKILDYLKRTDEMLSAMEELDKAKQLRKNG